MVPWRISGGRRVVTTLVQDSEGNTAEERCLGDGDLSGRSFSPPSSSVVSSFSVSGSSSLSGSDLERDRDRPRFPFIFGRDSYSSSSLGSSS